VKNLKDKNKKIVRNFLLVGVIVCAAWFIAGNWTNWFAGSGQTPTPTPQLSTIKLTISPENIDVSEDVPVSIKFIDADYIDDVEEFEDYIHWSYWTDEESTKDAADVTFDMTGQTYAILHIDPDNETYIMEDMFLLTGPNQEYSKTVYHRPSDVKIAVQDVSDLDEYDGVSNGTFLNTLRLEYNSTNELHIKENGNIDWPVDDDQWDDMDAEDKLEVRNQANSRAIAPQYLMNEDTIEEYDDVADRYTNMFDVKIVLNDTLVRNSSSVYYTDYEILEENGYKKPIETVFDTTNGIIHNFFEEVITFDFDSTYTFLSTITLGANRSYTVQTCWTNLPSNYNSIGSMDVLSTASKSS